MGCELASADPYMFSHLTKNNNLTHSQVNSIFKDAEGYVWISTAWGLNRYDGYIMEPFLHDDTDSLSLPENYVNWVGDIPGDRLLIYNGNGYSLFDKRSETFSSAEGLFKSIGLSGYVDRVYLDSKSNLWLTSNEECYFYSFEHAELRSLEVSNVVDQAVGSLVALASSTDEVILVYEKGVILRVDYPVNGELGRVELLESPLQEGDHLALIDSDGDYWVVPRNKKGMWFYERKRERWHHCTSDATSMFVIDNSATSSITEDDKRRIWVGGDHDGLFIIDKHTQSVMSIEVEKGNERSLLSNSINCVYHDKQGVTWVGYCTEGLSFYNESIYKIKADALNIDDIDKNFKADINSIEEDRSGNLWFGTNGYGLLYKNVHTGEMKLYKHDPNDKNSLSGDIVVSLHSASDGSLWVGTYMGGLCRFDGRKFVSYRGRTDVPVAMAHENIWSVTEDDQKNIWIGSLGEGVVCYNTLTGKSMEYSEDVGLLSSNYVSKIIVGNDNKVYVGTARGVTIINSDKKASRILSNVGVGALETENINDLYEDSRGLLWIATRGGLMIYNKKTDKVVTLDKKDGFKSEVFNAIVEDADKNMWVVTSNGLANIVVNLNPRKSEYLFTTYNYDKPDGVLGCVLNLRAIKRTSYGELLIGGSDGLNSFVPTEIHYNKALPKVRFTDMAVFGEKLDVGEAVNGRVVLNEALIYSDEVTLDYSQNMFTVSFTTMSNILPEKVRYSYKLEGFNDKWIVADIPNVTYTNLAPGRYTLKVKAANCDGFSSDVASELSIVVLPPWWRSTLAIMVYFVILALVVMFIRLQITRRERERYKLKQIEADVQKQHEVDNMKLTFFTNVSHELRTPLSLIISPLEQLLSSSVDNDVKNTLSVVHRNACKLLDMVNQLLDFRKNDAKGMQLNLSEGDIVSFLHQACDSFRMLSERKPSFRFTSSMSDMYVMFDEDKMLKVVNNLLSNAYKFTSEEGSIDVWVGRSADESSIIIKISDSGIGIPDEYKSKVFDRFFQVPHQEGVYGGSGIGLHMVKEFVAMHEGIIEVGDNVGQGTVFVITLPIRKAQAELITEEEIEAREKSDKRTILIVDDSADFRKLLRDTFVAEYDILEAKNGEEALQSAIKNLPDIIITDVMMPVMNGIELCKSIKNDVRVSHIPIVMLTAKTAEEHKIEGLESGADDYISKPFNPQVLKLKVANLIEIGAKRQEIFQRQIDPEPSQITITSLDESLINKAIEYVEENMSRSELSVEELSRSLGMSRVHLYKKLIAITGRSPIEFIRVIRLKRAAQLLHDKQQNVSDVAYAVGFNNPKYFSKYFKEEFGVLPSVYQSNHDKGPTNIDI